jgi:hypothetical protein
VRSTDYPAINMMVRDAFGNLADATGEVVAATVDRFTSVPGSALESSVYGSNTTTFAASYARFVVTGEEDAPTGSFYLVSTGSFVMRLSNDAALTTTMTFTVVPDRVSLTGKWLGG